MLLIEKERFAAFMTEVITCTSQTGKQKEKMRIIFKAAEKYLRARSRSAQQFHIFLSEGSIEG